jgi:hypothetical protein
MHPPHSSWCRRVYGSFIIVYLHNRTPPEPLVVEGECVGKNKAWPNAIFPGGHLCEAIRGVKRHYIVRIKGN